MSDWGFKVSKTGYDVNTATPDQLATTSSKLSETIALSGFFNHTQTAASTTTTITHNLGYVPQFLLYDYTDSTFMPVVYGDTSGNFAAYDCYVTSTQLVFRLTQNTFGALTVQMYYKLLYNTVI